MKVTLQRIADACGVSRNTVSLAMRGSPRISLAVRDKIQAKAKEMGYMRDPELSRIMAKLSHRRNVGVPVKEEVACLQTIRVKATWAHADLIEGFHAYMANYGYNVVPYSFDFTDRNAKQLDRIFRTRGIRGILILPLPPRRNTIQLDFSNLAAVSIGRKLVNPLLHRVDNNYPNATRRCLDYLQGKGCHRIGAIISSIYDGQLNHAMRGAYLAWSSLLADDPSIPILDCNRPVNRDLKPCDLTEWTQKQGVDGIICMHYDEPLIRESFRETGRDLPYAIIRRSHDTAGPGTEPNIEGVVNTAAHILISELDHNRVGPPTDPQLTLINGLWKDT